MLVLFASWHVTDVFAKNKIASKTKTHSTKKYTVDEIVNIRIFSQIKVQSFTFSADAGAYSVWANGIEVANTTQSPLIKLTYVNGVLLVSLTL